MNVHLHIEQLVLDGLPIASGQGALVQAVFQAELAQLLSDGGLAHGLQEDATLPHVRADAIQSTSGDPIQLGQQIARSVYGSIGNAR